jgi:hypothetical protein
MENQVDVQPESSPVTFEVPRDGAAYAEWRQSGKLPEAKPAQRPTERLTAILRLIVAFPTVRKQSRSVSGRHRSAKICAIAVLAGAGL